VNSPENSVSCFSFSLINTTVMAGVGVSTDSTTSAEAVASNDENSPLLRSDSHTQDNDAKPVPPVPVSTVENGYQTFPTVVDEAAVVPSTEQSDVRTVIGIVSVMMIGEKQNCEQQLN
jgi:hypothetical protein